MLGLRQSTPRAFVDRFEANLEEMLLDHAHCEKKAAATALAFITKYPDLPGLVGTMAEIVEEEIAHFREVVAILERRGASFRGARGSAYAGALHAHVRRDYTEGLVDRLLVAALIEARSCERFALLGEHLQDDQLAEFYRSLFESEARHYAIYVKLALAVDDEPRVRARLNEWLDIEAEIIRNAEPTPHLHA